MSNLAIAVLVVAALLGILILGLKGMQRLILVVGLLAVAILALLIWAGKVRTKDVKESVDQFVGKDATAPGAAGSSQPRSSGMGNRVAILNALRVRGAVPESCREAAWTAQNLAAPTEVRIASVRRLISNGVVLELDNQPVAGDRLLDVLK